MRSGWTPATPGASLGRRDPTATGTLDTRVCTASATSSCPAISVSYTANGTIHEPGPGHNSRDGSQHRLHHQRPRSAWRTTTSRCSSTVTSYAVCGAALSSITLPTGTQAISVAAEPSVAVPIQLVLIDPSGTVVQTVSSSSGVAILEAPITQSGVYIIKTVNLDVGPVQMWSVATPLVSQM